MKFYMFTSLLIVVMAEEFLVMLYDNSNDYKMQMPESIEDSKYTRLLTDCDDGEFNENVNIPSTSKLKSQNVNPVKLSFGKYAAQASPGYQNYMQNKKSYVDGWMQQYGYNRPSYPNRTPLGLLPPSQKKRRQWVIQKPNGYNPIHRLKDNYYNNHGNLQIKDRSPYYNNKNIYNNNYNQYNNIQNNNNINYSKNSSNKKNNKNKSKNKYTIKYKNNNQHNNNKQNNNKTPGANNKSVDCNNGRCTICINGQCKECITGMGKCEICDGRSCSSVSL